MLPRAAGCREVPEGVPHHHYKPVSKTHDIKALVLECSKIDPSFRDLLKKEVDRLTEYAVETRYPGLFEPDIDEAREAIELASKVRVRPGETEKLKP